MSTIKISKDKTTTVISFFGGPGAGKSSAAAALYAAIKAEGCSVELVREYVKEWLWDERLLGTYEQIYFAAKQLRRESMFLGKVDYIVTDSPIWLNSFYAKIHGTEHIQRACEAICTAYYNQAKEDGHKYINLWQPPVGDYEQAGRGETEEEARDMDTAMKNFFLARGLSFITQLGTYKIRYEKNL
jgi:RecA/RadA recombinase